MDVDFKTFIHPSVSLEVTAESSLYSVSQTLASNLSTSLDAASFNSLLYHTNALTIEWLHKVLRYTFPG